MKVNRRHGRLRLVLDPVEVELLMTMFGELDALLDSGDDADEAFRRLNPAAYPDDPEAELDYRELTTESLRATRDERLAACRAELNRASDVDLSDAEAAQRWIQVLNDLRLALGTRLGITEDDHEFDPSDPGGQPRLVYYWLTAVQDSVVHGLMR